MSAPLPVNLGTIPTAASAPLAHGVQTGEGFSELRDNGTEKEVVKPTFSLAALSSPSICFAKVSMTHSLTGADLGRREMCPRLVEVFFVLVWFFN